jgi:hypothetical protein
MHQVHNKRVCMCYDSQVCHARTWLLNKHICIMQEKTQGLTFYSASHPDELRPLIQSIWEYVLPTLSKAFSAAGADSIVWRECLQGLLEAACVTAVLGFSFISSTFIRTLANFTSLHEPQNMHMQNAHALRQLLLAPERIGASLRTCFSCHARRILMTSVVL